MRRRAFLATAAAVTTPVVAGCSAIGDGSGGAPDYPEPPESMPADDADSGTPGQPPETVAETLAIGEEAALPKPRKPPRIALWGGGDTTAAVQVVDMGAENSPTVVHRDRYELTPDARVDIVLWTRSQYVVQIVPPDGSEPAVLAIRSGDYDCNTVHYWTRVARDDVSHSSRSTMLACPSHD